MAIENRLLDRPQSPRAAKRRTVCRWPVYRGPQWLGDVLVVDATITADPITFDAITPGGDQIGPFATRLDAAMAIGSAVQR